MRVNRFGTGFAVVTLMAAGLFSLGSIASPGSASARCAGVGNPVVSDFWYGGVKQVEESPAAGTCNGNSDYRATLRDTNQDGRFVSVQYRDAGYDWRRIADTTSSEEYRYFDRNNNSHAHIRLCVSGLGCGWGYEPGGYGVNDGF
jgi:hypothetical protein